MVQLYVRDPVASVTRPIKQLAGFVRVELAPGETRRITFHLDPGQLAFYDSKMRLVVEPGEVKVLVGASSDDIRGESNFNVTGKIQETHPARAVGTRVEVS